MSCGGKRWGGGGGRGRSESGAGSGSAGYGHFRFGLFQLVVMDVVCLLSVLGLLFKMLQVEKNNFSRFD